MRSLSRSDIENTLHHLNYRWNLEALSLWKGDKAPFKAYEMYEGYDGFISLDTLSAIDAMDGGDGKRQLRFALIDHYLQRALLPHENEMRSWMRGAAATFPAKKSISGTLFHGARSPVPTKQDRFCKKKAALCANF